MERPKLFNRGKSGDLNSQWCLQDSRGNTLWEERTSLLFEDEDSILLSNGVELEFVEAQQNESDICCCLCDKTNIPAHIISCSDVHCDKFNRKDNKTGYFTYTSNKHK